MIQFDGQVMRCGTQVAAVKYNRAAEPVSVQAVAVGVASGQFS